VHLPDFARTTTFRWTLTVAGAFVLCILVLFGFVYWQTATYMTSRVDSLITQELNVVAASTPDWWLRQDPRRIRVAGLFGADGRYIEGNIESLPPGLTPDVPTSAAVFRFDSHGRELQRVRVIAHLLPDGHVFVIGRNIEEIVEIADIVRQALILGLLPAFALALIIGIVLSQRAHDRILEVNRKLQRIVAGDLRARLPTSARGDTFDQIAVSVNGMLGDIESLIREIASVGDNIAHDLRTPLTRVRIRLERGREHASTLEELRAVNDQAIAGLDQSLNTITALLRITEIEHTRRLDGFGQVPLGPLVREVRDLYDPIAEDKGVLFRVEVIDETTVHGDRDLLFEAVANLVDNAIKFTPTGGHVDVILLLSEGATVIRVKDTGPGISEIEREAVTKRFYRSDKSRGTEGLGLGLSLVAAIIKLHGFEFAITAGPGCTVEIVCPEAR
jgi:signal transduction histidine kinase